MKKWMFIIFAALIVLASLYIFGSETEKVEFNITVTAPYTNIKNKLHIEKILLDNGTLHVIAKCTISSHGGSDEQIISTSLKQNVPKLESNKILYTVIPADKETLNRVNHKLIELDLRGEQRSNKVHVYQWIFSKEYLPKSTEVSNVIYLK